MKKKIILSILTGLCACLTSAAFSACGGGAKHTHEYLETARKEATCTETGLITYTCECEEFYTEEIPATGVHTWDNGEETTAPTCTQVGETTYTCTVCETTTYTEEIPALTHDEKTHEAQAPTCTEIGWEEYVTCEREGCDYSTYKEIPATGVHTWDNGEETLAPTCTQVGETTYTCTVCETATKTEPIDKLPHEHSAEWSSNATYHWHKCICGDKKDEETHTAGAPATATTPQTCTVCGYILQAETGILFNTLDVDGTKVYGKVSNATTEFSFINEVTVKGNATYVVDNNKDCASPIYSKTVDLVIGDNTFYVLEMIGNDVKLFTVTIRRRPMYEVTFNANGGASVEKQVIEEDHFATEPETARVGYTFTGWDYDFATPITKTTKITASWSANTDTKYTVNYYLQNLDDSNYTPYETVELTGTTDTMAYGETDRYTHFTHKPSATDSGNINPDGSQVLSVYYTRDSYNIVSNINNAKAGAGTAGGTYKFEKQITLTATTNVGYTWLGWYDGETLACETEEFTFKAEKDVTYTATWLANTDTKYTVIYYLQNLDDDNYTPYETVELKGETDTPTAKVDIREYTHFTYNASKSVVSGNIDGDGGQVLSVYYTRNVYTLSINEENAGIITNAGGYKYGTKAFISAVSTPNLGYNFVGWYRGEELLSTDLKYTFKAEFNVTANFEVVAEMSNFEFTSTTTTCKITGIKDKTVTEIIVPDYVTSIGSSAFSGCSSLTEITLPFVGAKAGVTASDTYQYPFGYIFGRTSYTGRTATKQYYYGSSTSSTTYSTYYIPTSLKKVTITGGNILYGAFYNCDSLTSVEIPDSVTSIGSSAFAYCSSLTSIEIPDSVTSIGDSAFAGCNSLTEITLPFVGATKDGTSNTHLGYIFGASDYSYNDDYVPASLKKVTVTGDSIGDYAFYYCDSLTSVVIPDSVTSIGDSAFYDCDSLTSVVIPDSVTSIGDWAFGGCSSLTSITVSGNNTAYQSIDGNLYSKDGKTLIRYAIGKTATSFAIPDSVTSIGNGAFSSCSSLKSVVIPDSVTSIGDWAFNYCRSLTSVVIPDSVTSIGSNVFRHCSSLWSVVIPDSVTSIGDHAFFCCSSLKSVEIPDSVTSIGDYAFASCSSLTSVEIPDSVTSIGNYAFASCSSLNSITFEDTSTWYRTTSSSNWQNKTGGTSTSVTYSYTNATYFKSTYDDCYWYKR